MPEILNAKSPSRLAECEPCSPYRDNSLYLEDATLLLEALDLGKFQEKLAEQLRAVIKAAHAKEQTADELHTEISKLHQTSDAYRRIVGLKDRVIN